MEVNLETDFQDAVKLAESEYEWFRFHRMGYFFASWSFRVLAAISLVLGAVLPLTSKNIWNFANPAQAAVACLLLGGLLIGMDKVFMISETWSRYATAMMKIKTLITVAEWDWKEEKQKIQSPPSPDDLQRASTIRKTLVLGTRQVVEAETASWSTELSAAVGELQRLISDQRTAAEVLAATYKTNQEAAATAPAHGTVRLTISGKAARIESEISIKVGGTVVKAVSSLAGKHILENQPKGIAVICVEGKDSAGAEVTVEDAIDVKAGIINDLSLTIPEK